MADPKRPRKKETKKRKTQNHRLSSPGNEPPKKAHGRPTILNEELTEELVGMILAGAYIETAAAVVGISKSVFFDWLKRGAKENKRLNDKSKKPRKKEAPFLEFSNAIRKAQARAEISDLAIITEAAKRSWQAAAWKLERRSPERFAKTVNTELSGPGGKPIESSVDVTVKFVGKKNDD